MAVHSVIQNGVDDLNTKAISLIKRALEGYDDTYGAGFMSCAVYDTAWVSLVSKIVDGNKQWLFPECFQYILSTQSAAGGWCPDTGSQIDGILNTASSLLALKLHIAEPLNIHVPRADLEGRIERATTSIESQLESWQVSTTTHVGFEIIVPALLGRLEAEDPQLVFDFEGRHELEKINAIKLSRFKPEYLYGPVKLTALHSLEAFIGKVDFDKVAHHKVQGAMMASPSSTAAYLMQVSRWDDEAEAYLRQVIRSGAGRGDGGVPSAYPSMHFEYTWILSTLFRAGFTPSELECPELSKIREILARAFEEDGGVIGFAPRLQADVDDTAKGIICLNALGHPIGPEKMIETFETDRHFRTYTQERDPGFSANCNALLALLHQPETSRFSSQILKLIRFLCDYWWNSDGTITDKWNLCHLYPSLLIVEALTDVVALVEDGGLEMDQNMQSRVLITLFQACQIPLLTQDEDGSWNGSTEETAYGVLTLSEARRVCLFEYLRQPLDIALHRGRAFLQSSGDHTANHIWIEKVTYASPLLTHCYVLAALKASSRPCGAKVGSTLFDTAPLSKKISRHVSLFQLTPLFSHLPEWQLWSSMIEATLFQPLLRARRLEVFPRKDMEQDKYFDIIPFTWTACNNRSRTFASTSYIYEMMVISFLNYQADEFMEAVAGPAFLGRTEELRRLIDRVFARETTPINGNGHLNDLNTNDTGYQEVFGPLSKFVAHVSSHPAVVSASAWERESTRRELRTFLQAHVSQSADNASFLDDSQRGRETFTSATQPFFQWVRTTSADHTSCPYSFAFVSCLLSAGNQGLECFPTVSEKYYAAAMCRHLATMCRMYNDYGSVARDKAENNLNSINFLEFGSENPADVKMKALFKLSEYERSCLDQSRRRLREEDGSEAKERQMALWDMFCDVTDLYGQIYVVRDIASRMAVPGKGKGRREDEVSRGHS